jgi:hypothetical protein
MKITNRQAIVANQCGKKVQTHQDDEVRYIFTPIKKVLITILKIFCFGQALKRKKKLGQI